MYKNKAARATINNNHFTLVNLDHDIVVYNSQVLISIDEVVRLAAAPEQPLQSSQFLLVNSN
jgi:hypothetical protein